MTGRSHHKDPKVSAQCTSHQLPQLSGCLVGEEGKPIKLLNLSPPGSFPPATNESHSFLLPSTWPGYQGLSRGLFPGAVSLVPYKGGLFPPAAPLERRLAPQQGQLSLRPDHITS